MNECPSGYWGEKVAGFDPICKKCDSICKTCNKSSPSSCASCYANTYYYEESCKTAEECS